jgi:tetratricopeptide (TPR) repeat protein
MRAHHTQINLNRLTSANVRTIVAQVAAKIALSDETIATVVERTSGVPLFVEELTRAVLERGGDGANREIPETLHDSLMARLDRLGGTAKEVAQVAAVIGREFSYELLHAVHPVAEVDLQFALAKLAEAELVYARGIAPDATYTFKHALIQDAAYEALLKTRRRELHRKIAQTITEQFAELAEAHSEVLARHWTEAGEIELAIAAWSRAAKNAQERNAFAEAQESYRQTLALLELLPASRARDLRELGLVQSIVPLLRVTRGYAAPETLNATERVAALAEKVGDLKQLSQSLQAKFLAAANAGNYSSALVFADQALEIALREGNRTVLAGAYCLEALGRHWCGDLAGSERHFAKWLECCDDPDFKQFIEATISTFGHASWNAWILGRADSAREREARMMNASIGDNPYRAALASCRAAHLRICLGEYQEAETLAAQALRVSEQNEFPHLIPNSQCILGFALAQMDRVTEGIELIRRGLTGTRGIGSGVSISILYSYLAEAQRLGGATEDAMQTIEQALRANLNELAYRPEAMRLRGVIRFKLGQRKRAEDDFREAIALARTMSAKAWELRTTMSLSRLLKEQGRREEARAMLVDIYGWFSEGFDTADLIDAKTLLDELSG